MTRPDVVAIRNIVDMHREEILQALLDFVAISSVTADEGKAQRFAADLLSGFGLEVDTFLSSEEEMADYLIHVGEQPTYEDRPSVVATRKGAGGGKSLMFAGHVDTVPVEDRTKWSRKPEGEIVGDRLYGLGSTDMKNGVIAAMFLPKLLDELGITLRGDVLVNTVVGEEDGGLGTMSTILHGYRPDGVVITEPTNQRIGVASGGSLVFRITVTGKAAHGANRNEGVSAIEKFVPIFQALLDWEAERQRTVHHPLYDGFANKFPISVGKIRSGDWASTVPDKLTTEGRLGFLPGESMESMMEQTRALVARVAAEDEWLRDHPPLVEFFSGQFVAEEIAVDHPLTVAMASAHKQVSGNEAEIFALTAGTDQRLWVHFADCPSLLYGGGVFAMAHQSDEYIEIEPFLESIAVLIQLAIDWCEIA